MELVNLQRQVIQSLNDLSDRWMINNEELRGLFKGTPSGAFLKLVYITGILPIKKYGTQSALNNFREHTMASPRQMEEYVGFTKTEVN